MRSCFELAANSYLRNNGWACKLTRAVKDGGYDLYGTLGSFTFVGECKSGKITCKDTGSVITELSRYRSDFALLVHKNEITGKSLKMVRECTYPILAVQITLKVASITASRKCASLGFRVFRGEDGALLKLQDMVVLR